MERETATRRRAGRRGKTPGKTLAPLLALLLLGGARTLLAAAQSSAASCADPLDVVLCLDGSGSMSYNYPKVQSFAQDFANKFTLGDTETRLAVLRFSTSTVDGTGEGTF